MALWFFTGDTATYIIWYHDFSTGDVDTALCMTPWFLYSVPLQHSLWYHDLLWWCCSSTGVYDFMISILQYYVRYHDYCIGNATTVFCTVLWLVYGWCSFYILLVYDILITRRLVQLHHLVYHDFCFRDAATTFCVIAWLLYWCCNPRLVLVLLLHYSVHVYHYDFYIIGTFSAFSIVLIMILNWYCNNIDFPNAFLWLQILYNCKVFCMTAWFL